MDLLEFLIDRGRLDETQRDRISALCRERGESASVIITRLGIIGEREMAEILAEFLAIPLARQGDFPQTPLRSVVLGADFIGRAQVLPIRLTDEGLVLAMADPTDVYTIKAVRLAVGTVVVPWVAVPSELSAALERLYGISGGKSDGPAEAPRVTDDDRKRLNDSASDEPVIRYVNWLIGRAAALRASDIHIEASPDQVVLRLRVDGMLRDIAPPPGGLQDNLVSRIKVMAGLNIAERRLPQDGRFRIVVEGREIDLRISVVPTLYGESVAMRLLDRAHAPLDLAGLGFAAELGERLTGLLHSASGMMLVTGPTGSGKTSTLYAALQLLNTRTRKILTLEDPVEYQLSGINQIPVRPAIGLDFPMLLRSLLRQDPDVMLVGEIRDLETARIAAQAALTGHLVLSTLHTNDAVTAVTRLFDMGVDDYLIGAVLKGVMAQRLVRCLCRACRCPYATQDALRDCPQLGSVLHGQARLFRPGGCDACGGTGYRGRTAIAEFLVFDERLTRCVVSRTDAATLRAEAQSAGMINLETDGLAKVVAGITSVDEVRRVLGTE